MKGNGYVHTDELLMENFIQSAQTNLTSMFKTISRPDYLDQSKLDKLVKMHKAKIEIKKRILKKNGIKPDDIDRIVKRVVSKYDSRIKSKIKIKKTSGKISERSETRIENLDIDFKDLMDDIIVEFKGTFDLEAFSKTLLSLFLVVMLNTLAYHLIFIIMAVFVGGQTLMLLSMTLTAVLVGPFVEEAYKSSTVNTDNTAVGFAVFNTFEFANYIMKYGAAMTRLLGSSGMMLLIIARIIAVIMHAGATRIHATYKMRSSMMDKSVDNDMQVEARTLATVFHSLYNMIGMLGTHMIPMVAIAGAPLIAGIRGRSLFKNKIKKRLKGKM